MKSIIIALAGLLAMSTTACAQAQKKENNTRMEHKTLVAYFSATGTTQVVAQKIAKAAGADLYEIVPEQEYTAADLDWTNERSRSTVEMKDPNSRPAIKGGGVVKNMEQYDTIYIGFPIWWYQQPTIINTFIEANKLDGKVVKTFATSGGSNTKRADALLKATYPAINWRPGTLLNNPSAAEIANYVK